MDGPPQFLTEEYFRYAQECRRLARLSTNPQRAVERRRQATLGSRFSEWLREAQGWWAPLRQPVPLPARPSR